MASGFVIRRGLYILPVLLLALAFIGCGMMSVLVDEDGGEDTEDAGANDAAQEDAGPDYCGDGIIQGRYGEACDGIDVGGATCGSIGQGSGRLSCNDRCQFDLTLCSGGNTSGDGGVFGDGGFVRFGDGGPII